MTPKTRFFPQESRNFNDAAVKTASKQSVASQATVKECRVGKKMERLYALPPETEMLAAWRQPNYPRPERA